MSEYHVVHDDCLVAAGRRRPKLSTSLSRSRSTSSQLIDDGDEDNGDDPYAVLRQ